MKYNGITVPTGRDNTYSSDEVHRPDMDRRSDWSQTDAEKESYLRNKPAIVSPQGLEEAVQELHQEISDISLSVVNGKLCQKYKVG